MDYSNTHSLKKSLSSEFDFLNTGIQKYSDYNKKLIKKLQNMEWNPKIKIFFSSTNLNYNHKIGKTLLCLFQMHNHLPGTAVLHRTDLLIDMIKNFTSKKENLNCYKPNRFIPKSMRLYKKNECARFFQLIETEDFKKKMKTNIIYIFRNVESHRDETLDFIEIQKLKKIYKSGQLCGKIKRKFVISEYFRNQLRYKNGRKFIIRVFFIIISSKPLVVLFEQGYVLLDRFNN